VLRVLVEGEDGAEVDALAAELARLVEQGANAA
jgi:hypothetical protein